MRERITFIHGPDAEFNSEQLEVRKDFVRVRDLDAAREDRLTFSFQELPPEIWRVLKQCHELHLRWSSAQPYPLLSPFNARTSPGLHVFFTPHKNHSADFLCPLLKKTFDENLKCITPEETFTPVSLISERFASASFFQYYQTLPSLQNLSAYIVQTMCSSQNPLCLKKLEAIESADYFDIDYDSISQAFVLKTYRHQSPHGRWNEDVKAIKDAKLEIGVLNPQDATELEHLKMGGFLVVVGEDDKLKPTLFSFPARHHSKSKDDQIQSSASAYSVSFIQPTGLHPHLRLSINTSAPQSTSNPNSCSLLAYLTLPSTIFPDKYQLEEPLLLKDLNIRSIRSISGYTDLEAPEYAVKSWGSSLLIELNASQSTPGHSGDAPNKEFQVRVPLHLRYLSPAQGSGVAKTTVPWPVIFWACTAEEGSKMSTNPFDRVNLGYDGLFGTKTMFYHLAPIVNISDGETAGLVEHLSVPVLDSDWVGMRNGMVEVGTAFVVLFACLWVSWKLLLISVGSYRDVEQVKEKKIK